MRKAIEAGVRQIDGACRAAIGGRGASRALGEWLRRFNLNEADFQVLWCLRSADDCGLDQTTLARRLSFSTAQVSATVERMRLQAWIVQQSALNDRRRHRWELSTAGRSLLNTMVGAASALSTGLAPAISSNSRDLEIREAA